jgi:protein SCO1
MSGRMKGIIIGIVGLTVLLIGLLFRPSNREDKEWKSENKIDTYWEIGDFELIDQNGDPFSSEQLAGKIWVANFVFTSCAAECPLLSQQMSLVRRNIGDRPDIAFVSFSVDPQTDTPARLASYAEPFGLDPRWSLLTGDVDKVTKLVTSKFLVPLNRDEDPNNAGDTVISHSDKMLIIDGKGVVRYFCNGLNQRTVQSLTDVIQVLLQESGVY